MYNTICNMMDRFSKKHSSNIRKAIIGLADSDFEYDSESEDSKPDNHEKYIKCECGGNFQLFNDIVICDTCNRTSDYSIDDINKITDTKISLIYGATAEQRKQVRKDLEIRNKNAIQMGIMPLSDKVINGVVDFFSDLKKWRSETRNKKRCQYLGSCIWFVCIQEGQWRTQKDIQAFCGLSDRNLTTTIGEIIMEMNLGKIKYAINLDSRESYCTSICLKEKIDERCIPMICDDVKYISDIITEHMLISSNSNSKILGSIFCGIRLHGFNINLKKICISNKINPETVINVINSISENMYLFHILNERCLEVNKMLTAKLNKSPNKLMVIKAVALYGR